MTPRTVFALDLALRQTGWAWWRHDRGIYSGVARTKQETGDERLIAWEAIIAGLYPKNCDMVVIEGPAYGRHHKAHGLGELHGVVKAWLWNRESSIVTIPPTTLKKFATGKGNASKEMMLAEAVRRLDYPGHHHDEADALWLMQAVLHQYDRPEKKPLPKAQTAVLETIQWPKSTE